MQELRKGLYFVGARDPELKVFDVIVPTDTGTTYNAYLLRGEKTALIETCHDRFAADLEKNIEEICPLSDIDYIIADHTEPDHSGALHTILDANPDVTVYGSAPALKNLKNILNRDLNSVVAKQGGELDLGGFTLKFFSAPNLHWPDSIFTYCEELRCVFTCDFLGCHYCAETDDGLIADDSRYLAELERYYTYIFGPFPAAVKKGLSIIRSLDVSLICPSHGPVLTKGIERVCEVYDRMSEDKTDKDLISVFYVSAYGYTAAMAEALAEGAREAGKNVSVYEITGTEKSVLAKAVQTSGAYMFGSPTLNRDALPPVYDLLNNVSAVLDRNKPALIFGSFGWSGEACGNLAARAAGLGLAVDEELCKVCFKPSEEDLAHLREKGKAFAEKV
ncbi:MAG: FprA family A-type flavoprotein [Oscillospiraceae bacterium]|nr:FprA family A-type flavoprotein [Oscillospiraceae bacterium]